MATDGFLDWIRTALIVPEFRRERTLSLLGAGGTGLSPLSYATVYGGCPWALSLLSALDERAAALEPEATSPEARAAVTDSLILHLVLGFPLASEAGNPWACGFGRTLAHAAVFWHGVEADEGKRLGLERLLRHHVRLSDPEVLLQILRSLHEGEEVDRRVFLNALRGLAHSGAFPADEVLRVVSDPLWFRRAMMELGDDELVQVLDALLAAERRFGGDWHATLPHLIAGAVDLEGLPPGRREFLVQNVTLACAASGTASAVRRLALGPRPSRHLASLRNFRKVLESYMPVGSPWVTSRLRDILSSLPAAAPPAMLPSPPRE